MSPSSGPGAQQSSAEATYFIMACDAVAPAAAVRRQTKWPGMPWMTGAFITSPVPSPLLFAADAAYPGELLAMYDDAIPIMRADLIAALRDAGVDNLQTFPAVVRDLEGKDHTDYQAVNIIGLVSAADMNQSTLMQPSAGIFGADFESLVIDEDRAGGALLFRLAESTNAIVAHRSVRDRILGTIRGMSFYGPGEWAG